MTIESRRRSSLFCLLPLLCAAWLPACMPDRGVAQDQAVTLTLRNSGVDPLRCRLMFGHWVDRDLGTLTPGAATTLSMTQAAADGALYILRSDGQRKMMIETIQCAQPGDWMRNFGQVDFAPIRSRRTRSIEAICAAPAAGGRVACHLDDIS